MENAGKSRTAEQVEAAARSASVFGRDCEAVDTAAGVELTVFSDALVIRSGVYGRAAFDRFVPIESAAIAAGAVRVHARRARSKN